MFEKRGSFFKFQTLFLLLNFTRKDLNVKTLTFKTQKANFWVQRLFLECQTLLFRIQRLIFEIEIQRDIFES